MGKPPTEKTIARFDKQQREAIAKMYLNGARVEEVGKAHGAGSITIRYLLKHMSVAMRKPGESARIDLTNKPFGRLIALEDIGSVNSGGNNVRLWKCKCDCGAFVEVVTPSLTSGNTQSCGCYKNDRITETQRIDPTGQTIGSLTAIRFSHNITKANGNKGQAYWLWRCDCGNELTASFTGVNKRFKENNDVSCTSCAAKKRAIPRKSDFTNQPIGRLTGVRQIDLNKSPAHARWLWKCECGNTCIRYVSNVKSRGLEANCGCSNRDTSSDGTGIRFGLLVALEKVGKKPGESTYTWRFKCDCGNICEARLRDAVSGLQRSCGCRQGGYDNIEKWVQGEFRNAEDPAFFYIFPLVRFPGYSKPGIAEDLETRKKGSRGEYGEVFDYIELPRLEAWLIEQAVLINTRTHAGCPRELQDKKWEGYTEVRYQDPNLIFEIALKLLTELEELGRVEFAIRHLPTTPKERRALRTFN